MSFLYKNLRFYCSTAIGQKANVVDSMKIELSKVQTDPAHSKYYSDQGRIHIIKNGVQGTPILGWANTLNEE